MKSGTKIIASLGSNVNQIENLDFAKRKLIAILGEETLFTESVWTEPIGIESDRFLNCLCVAETRHTLQQLLNAFKHIEKKCSRTKKNDKMNKITLDIDILQYGEERLHQQDWNRKYIKELMGDIENNAQEFIIDPTLTKKP